MLAREGSKLALCARTGSELEQTVKEIQAQGRMQGLELRCLVGRARGDFVANVMKLFGRIDV